MINESTKKDINILVVSSSTSVHDNCKIKLGKICNLLHAKSEKSAKDFFELNKYNLNFVIITSVLEKGYHYEAVPFVKQMRLDEEFKGKLIATGNYREEIFGNVKDGCHYECIADDLPAFIISLIADLNETKKSRKKEKKS